MSMGFGANFAEVIEDDTLQGMFPEAHAAFMAALKKAKLNIDEWAVMEDDEKKEFKSVTKAEKALTEEFAKKFDGLTIGLDYHNQEDDGDRYDEVDGAYWNIEGLYVLSEGAKKLGKGNWSRKFFVTMG